MHPHLSYLFLGSHTEFLFFVHNEQPQIFEIHIFAQDAVGADEDIDFAFLEPLQRLFLLFGTFKAVDVIDGDRKIFQPFRKGFKMLHYQDGGGHQYGHLLAVGHRFKSRPDGNFGFTEAHIAADKPVHGMLLFHVVFNRLRGLYLVGRVFVNKTGFQFGLQVAVRLKSVSLHGFSFGIQFNEVAGNVFDF